MQLFMIDERAGGDPKKTIRDQARERMAAQQGPTMPSPGAVLNSSNTKRSGDILNGNWRRWR